MTTQTNLQNFHQQIIPPVNINLANLALINKYPGNCQRLFGTASGLNIHLINALQSDRLELVLKYSWEAKHLFSTPSGLDINAINEICTSDRLEVLLVHEHTTYTLFHQAHEIQVAAINALSLSKFDGIFMYEDGAVSLFTQAGIPIDAINIIQLEKFELLLQHPRAAKALLGPSTEIILSNSHVLSIDELTEMLRNWNFKS